MENSSLSDEELWSLIVKDDHNAFTLMFKKHWLKLYKCALHYVKDAEASEEIVHDLFLNIWRRRNFLVINNFDKYFKAATRYQVYTYLKKHKGINIEYKESYGDESYGAHLNTAHEKISYQELEGRLVMHLKSLPYRCQEVFILSRLQNLDNNEIAKKLGISKRTVENQITRALQCIRFNINDILFTIMFLMMIW